MRILFIGGSELGKIALESMVVKERNIMGVVTTRNESQWYKGPDIIAHKYGIPLYGQVDVNDINFINTLKELSPDIIAVVNFDQILKSEVIGIPKTACLNTHASLLPAYRGRAPLNWAIINGEKETGVTVHYINEGIDTGDIIIQKKVEIKEDDYVGDVLERVREIYSYIVDGAIELIENGRVLPRKQDLSKGSYYPKRSPADGQISWQKTVSEIYNLVRAISRPYPGAYTYCNNKKLLLWKAKIHKSTNVVGGGENAEIIDIDSDRILVKARGGYLEILEYEYPGEIRCGDLLKYYKDD
ncbi:MAG: methionyl-tRNA formyltransferase [Clostridium sp.]|nr:methionyl-tRNA formyltransferase [Clostridium sp.]